MKSNKIIVSLLVLIIIILGILCTLLATGKIEVNKSSDKNTKQEVKSNTTEETKNNTTNENKTSDTEKTNEIKESINCAGTYKDGDFNTVTITKSNDTYNVTIGLTKLAEFEGSVTDIKNDILYISSTDPSGAPIKFTFDHKTKKLVVQETTWNNLNVNDSYELNN